MESLDDLREEVEAFLVDEAEALRAPMPPTLRDRFDAHRQLASAEATRRVEDALGAKSTAEAVKPGLLRLRRFLADALETSLCADAHDRLRTLEHQGVLYVGAETIALADALDELRHSSARDRRGALELAYARFVAANEREEARRIDAQIETARRLGRPDYPALRSELDALALDKLTAAAEELLRRTEDAFRDLLGFALRRIDPKLRPLPHGGARWHDLQHLATFPWLRGDFPEGGRIEALRRWVNELGLDALERGRVRLEPGASEPVVAAFRVPTRIELRAARRGGLDGYRALFEAAGQAHLFSSAPDVAPLEDRRLPDPALLEGTGQLFARVLTDERWLRRYLELPRAQAREVARLAALDALTALRTQAALFLHALSVHARGVSSAVADEFADRMAAALFTAWPKELFLRVVPPHLHAARALRGAWFEAALHRRLLERYDEDFFRNPAAGHFLAGLMRRMAFTDLDPLAGELGATALELTSAGDRLVRVMAA